MSSAGAAAIHVSYLLATALFVFGLRKMARVKTARGGAGLAALGMLVATVATVISLTDPGWAFIGAGLLVGTAIGAWLARTVKMTAMPELVAVFNGMGGAASALVALAFLFGLPLLDTETLSGRVEAHVVVVLVASVFVGGLTLTGSLVAWAKLSGRLGGAPILLPGRHVLNAGLIVAVFAGAAWGSWTLEGAQMVRGTYLAVTAVSLLLGVLLVVPIGGADMPVVISLLNSYSGIAASMAGFVLLSTGQASANVLIIAGALVGASGLILTQIMCVAMNRSLLNVLVGGFGDSGGTADLGDQEYEGVRSTSAEEVALVLEAAETVIFVPGYGLAVAQAQHALAKLDNLLTARGVDVRYAIHPVAGRMPGHMNVLLAEANVPHEKQQELERINGEFRTTDVAIVVGANDVTNPQALDEPNSPIYGMPILETYAARSVVVIKRSLSPGYAGIKNPLFERDNTVMLFDDARKALGEIATEVEAL